MGTDQNPPESLPEEVVTFLREASPEQRRAVMQYADELESSDSSERSSPESVVHSAETGASEDSSTVTPGESSEPSTDQENREHGEGTRSEERPDDVPAKATITIKEINDNRYYYWQWRDGEKIRSKYKGPVST